MIAKTRQFQFEPLYRSSNNADGSFNRVGERIAIPGGPSASLAWISLGGKSSKESGSSGQTKVDFLFRYPHESLGQDCLWSGKVYD